MDKIRKVRKLSYAHSVLFWKSIAALMSGFVCQRYTSSHFQFANCSYVNSLRVSIPGPYGETTELSLIMILL